MYENRFKPHPLEDFLEKKKIDKLTRMSIYTNPHMTENCSTNSVQIDTWLYFIDWEITVGANKTRDIPFFKAAL